MEANGNQDERPNSQLSSDKINSPLLNKSTTQSVQQHPEPIDTQSPLLSNDQSKLGQSKQKESKSLTANEQVTQSATQQQSNPQSNEAKNSSVKPPLLLSPPTAPRKSSVLASSQTNPELQTVRRIDADFIERAEQNTKNERDSTSKRSNLQRQSNESLKNVLSQDQDQYANHDLTLNSTQLPRLPAVVNATGATGQYQQQLQNMRRSTSLGNQDFIGNAQNNLIQKETNSFLVDDNLKNVSPLKLPSISHLSVAENKVIKNLEEWSPSKYKQTEPDRITEGLQPLPSPFLNISTLKTTEDQPLTNIDQNSSSATADAQQNNQPLFQSDTNKLSSLASPGPADQNTSLASMGNSTNLKLLGLDPPIEPKQASQLLKPVLALPVQPLNTIIPQSTNLQRQNNANKDKPVVANQRNGGTRNYGVVQQERNSNVAGPFQMAAPMVNQSKIIINSSRTEYPLVDEVAKEMGWRISKVEDWTKADFDLWWSDLGIDGCFFSQLKPYQKVNHFPAMFHIARKTFLAKNLKRLQRLYPMEFNFFPRTWCLPNEINDLRSAQEIAARQRRVENGENSNAPPKTLRGKKDSKKQAIGFTMIMKPDSLSQGKGIFLSHDIDSVPRDGEPWVVQEYLSNPLLIDGLKQDFRVYVLILSCEPLKIFVYKEGMVRFATQKYNPIDINSNRKELNNLFVHLTNYSLNKDSSSFRAPTSVQDDSAHKRTITSVFNTLKVMGHDIDKLWSGIKDIIIKTMLTIQPELSHSYRTCQPADQESLMCFEVLGFDIILTDELQPMLLEVNHAPSFNTDSPLDHELKKQLFIDMFNLLGLSISRKKEKLQQIYEDRVARMTQKQSFKERTKQKAEQLAQMRANQNKLESETGGQFEKIFPLGIEEAKIEFERAKADTNMNENQQLVYRQSYQALYRQQERYQQYLETIQSVENERSAKFHLKLEEKQKRELQEKERKEKERKEKRLRDKQALEAYKQLEEDKRHGRVKQQTEGKSHSFPQANHRNISEYDHSRNKQDDVAHSPNSYNYQSSMNTQRNAQLPNDTRGTRTTNQHYFDKDQIKMAKKDVEQLELSRQDAFGKAGGPLPSSSMSGLSQFSTMANKSLQQGTTVDSKVKSGQVSLERYRGNQQRTTQPVKANEIPGQTQSANYQKKTVALKNGNCQSSNQVDQQQMSQSASQQNARQKAVNQSTSQQNQGPEIKTNNNNDGQSFNLPSITPQRSMQLQSSPKMPQVNLHDQSGIQNKNSRFRSQNTTKPRLIINGSEQHKDFTIADLRNKVKKVNNESEQSEPPVQQQVPKQSLQNIIDNIYNLQPHVFSTSHTQPPKQGADDSAANKNTATSSGLGKTNMNQTSNSNATASSKQSGTVTMHTPTSAQRNNAVRQNDQAGNNLNGVTVGVGVSGPVKTKSTISTTAVTTSSTTVTRPTLTLQLKKTGLEIQNNSDKKNNEANSQQKNQNASLPQTARVLV